MRRGLGWTMHRAFLFCCVLLGCSGSSENEGSTADDAAAEADDDAATLTDTTAPADVSADVAPDVAPDAAKPCPTAPPFDDGDPAYAACVRRVWIAGGQGMRRIASYDGSTWENAVDDRKPSGNDEWAIWGAAFGKGLVVVAGDGGAFTSSDGKSWTKLDAVKTGLHSAKIAFFKGAFVIVGSGATYTSTDGATWNAFSGATKLPGDLDGAFPGHPHAIATNGTHLVVVNDNAKFRVFDGTTWVERSVGAYSGWLSNVAFGGGKWVVTGDACCGATPPTAEGLRANSTDLMGWNDLQTNATGTALRFGQLVFDGTRFFATGTIYSDQAVTSSDGKAWSNVKMDHHIGPIAFAEGTYVGWGNGGGKTGFFRSSDGVGWSAGSEDTTMLGIGVIATGRLAK